MKTAVTLCRVPESAAGPFVFHGPLPESFAEAAALGYDAVELFLPGPDAVPAEEIIAMRQQHGLAIAAVGTGAGMVKHGLSLTDPSPEKRREALDFLLRMIGFGGRLGAPAILGSMQGKWSAEVPREKALDLLAGSLRIAGEAAAACGVPFIYEPLNRYETNLINHLAAAATFLEEREIPNVVLLADLFHMNIEETDIAAALRAAAPRLGHVHWADSNRHAMGYGHTPAAPVMEVLREISYSGYLSAEIFPLPDARTAAHQTLRSISRLPSI
jgi:sugar phosphate isomerase/epimerase